MQKQKHEERKESDRITWSPFSFYTLEEPFRWVNPWTGGKGEELKPFKFERNMRALRRSPRGAREDGRCGWDRWNRNRAEVLPTLQWKEMAANNGK